MRKREIKKLTCVSLFLLNFPIEIYRRVRYTIIDSVITADTGFGLSSISMQECFWSAFKKCGKNDCYDYGGKWR